MKQAMKHKGWFGLCPVYLSDAYSDEPMIHERLAVYLPLFILSEWIWGVMFHVRSAMDHTYEPAWPLRITGEFNPPLMVELGDDL